MTPIAESIPASLVPHGHEKLKDACYCIGAKVQVVADAALLRKLPYAKEFLTSRLPIEGRAFLKEKAQASALSLQRAHEWLVY